MYTIILLFLRHFGALWGRLFFDQIKELEKGWWPILAVAHLAPPLPPSRNLFLSLFYILFNLLSQRKEDKSFIFMQGHLFCNLNIL